MSDSSDQEVREDLRPDPAVLEFDLYRALTSIVSLRTRVPEDALTAQVLGTERAGHGVVVEDTGLVLTIGYLVTEADSVWLVDHAGAAVPGHVVGYDQETGLGLVQSLQPLSAPPLSLGDSSRVRTGDALVVAGHGGREQAVHARVTARREFAGYWEYVLDEALFTAPAHPYWGGTGALDNQGRLVGIGSLLVQQVDQSGEASGANMIVPTNLLLPILDDLKSFGRRRGPPRPWLGWLVQEVGRHLVVAGVYDHCPADISGLAVGDVIVDVDGQPVSGLAQLFRTIWGLGPAGVEVPMTVIHDNEPRAVVVQSVDRNERLRTGPLH